jgi:hypothetical protein
VHIVSCNPFVGELLVKRFIDVTDLVYSKRITRGCLCYGDITAARFFMTPNHAICSIGVVLPYYGMAKHVSYNNKKCKRQPFFSNAIDMVRSVHEWVNDGLSLLVHCRTGRILSPLFLSLYSMLHSVCMSCPCDIVKCIEKRQRNFGKGITWGPRSKYQLFAVSNVLIDIFPFKIKHACRLKIAKFQPKKKRYDVDVVNQFKEDYVSLWNEITGFSSHGIYLPGQSAAKTKR